MVPGRGGGVPGGFRVLQTPTLMVHSRFSVKIFLFLLYFAACQLGQFKHLHLFESEFALTQG